MTFKLEHIEYDQSRHAEAPSSANEELVWKTLDHIDQVLVLLASELLVGPVSDEMLPPPPSPSHIRAKVSDLASAYFVEVDRTLEDLRKIGLLPPEK
jgi:hypothetical protein